MIFGRTDLRKGVSGAKFDGQADFEVRLAVAPQKPDQFNQKLIFRSKIFSANCLRFAHPASADLVLERWSSGVPEFWSAGVLEHSNARPLACSNT